MKLTDFALIFVAILLPIVIIVYVNTAFVVKSEKQEMYYKNLMNSAILDAVSAMKQVENENTDIDYGYSGIVDKKVSINASLAISTFYNSLAKNFNISGNEISLARLKMYIPAIAVLDYDGIYIHSAEQAESGDIEFVTKPKVHYNYSYVILKTALGIGQTTYEMVSLEDIENLSSVKNRLLSDYIYEINFTMDDFVYLNIYEIENDGTIGKVVVSKGFYLTDRINNSDLVYDAIILSSNRVQLLNDIVSKLGELKNTTIAQIGMKEISYAVNKHNEYAKTVGINYTFRFSVESDAAWYETMDGIGMIAIIQGISFGNRYLNYKAYSASDLVVAKRYHVSKGITIEDRELSYFEKDLYHISENCTIYREYKNSTVEKISPSYYTSQAEAATQGYYPCPICKP